MSEWPALFMLLVLTFYETLLNILLKDHGAPLHP